MTNGYDRVAAALDNLRERVQEEGPPRHGALYINRIGRDDDLDEISLGIDSTHLIHLLTRLPGDRDRFPSPVAGPLKSEWRERIIDDDIAVDLLDITCIDSRVMPTLISLIGEMLDRMDDSPRPAIDELQEVIASWRRTLARLQARVSLEVLRGFFGELLVAEKLARINPAAVATVWKGPFAGRHDFASGNAVEVKTFTSGGLPVISVNGIDQLDPPLEGELHLVALRVAETPNGRSIDDVARSLGALGVKNEFLERAFNELGFQLGESADVKFVAEQARLYNVGDDFPGLRRSRMEADDLKGVDRVSYGLDLDAAPDQLPFDQLNSVLQALAG